MTTPTRAVTGRLVDAALAPIVGQRVTITPDLSRNGTPYATEDLLVVPVPLEAVTGEDGRFTTDPLVVTDAGPVQGWAYVLEYQVSQRFTARAPFALPTGAGVLDIADTLAVEVVDQWVITSDAQAATVAAEAAATEAAAAQDAAEAAQAAAELAALEAANAIVQPKARADVTTTSATISANTPTRLSFSTKPYDTANIIDTTLDQATIPAGASGVWHINAGVSINSYSNPYRRALVLEKGTGQAGTGVELARVNVESTDTVSLNLAVDLALAAGDVVSAYVVLEASGTVRGAEFIGWLALHRIP